MKKIISGIAAFGVILVFTSTAHALKIGDQVAYFYLNKEMPGVYHEQTNTVTKIESDNKSFLVSINLKTILGTSGSYYDTMEKHYDLPMILERESIFQNCESQPAESNARIETINVKAGTFETCHVTQIPAGGLRIDTYYANVPMGIVKYSKINPHLFSDNISYEMLWFTKW